MDLFMVILNVFLAVICLVQAYENFEYWHYSANRKAAYFCIFAALFCIASGIYNGVKYFGTT